MDKILIYDDKTILIFKTGDKETEITPELLNKIERGLGDETLCFSEAMGHHENAPVLFAPEFFCCAANGPSRQSITAQITERFSGIWGGAE